MKKYIVIYFLFIAANVFSQQTDPQQTPPPPNNQPQQIQPPPMQQGQSITPYNINMRNKIKAEKFKNLKIGGIVLLSAGVIGLVSGIALVSSGASNQIATNNSNSYNNSNSSTNSSQPIAPANASQIVGGVYLGVLGAFAIAGGTVMAAIGSHKEKQYNTAASRLSVVIAPTAFRIAYTF
jgi:hypothetical protein